MPTDVFQMLERSEWRGGGHSNLVATPHQVIDPMRWSRKQEGMEALWLESGGDCGASGETIEASGIGSKRKEVAEARTRNRQLAGGSITL